MDTFSLYERFLESLALLRTEFEEAVNNYPVLNHQLIAAGPLSDEGWKAWIATNSRGDDWQHWEIYPNGTFCGRFHGDEKGLKEFLRLANKGYSLLLELKTLSERRDEVPNGVTLNLPAYDGHYGWMEAVYLTARSYGTALLCVRQGYWGRSGQTTDEEIEATTHVSEINEKIPIHPCYEELPYDLFLSSVEAITLWLDSSEAYTVDEVQVTLPPIILPPCRSNELSQEAIAFLAILPAERPLPIWDRERRELRCGSILMKRYRQQPGNQESILDAFQDASWGRSPIDSPMKRMPKRLGYTVESLNGPQKHKDMLIRFRLDGTTRVIWDWCDCL